MVCQHGVSADEEQGVCALVCGPDRLEPVRVPLKVHSTVSRTESLRAYRSKKVHQTGCRHGVLEKFHSQGNQLSAAH